MLRVDCSPSLSFSVHPWSTSAIERAGHADELVEEGALWLHLDIGQNGLGSATCGPGVRPADQLIAPSARFRALFTSIGRLAGAQEGGA